MIVWTGDVFMRHRLYKLVIYTLQIKFLLQIAAVMVLLTANDKYA